MSYSTVITQIDLILKDATGVVDANVFKYLKLTKFFDLYVDAFKDDTNGVIHGYMITRGSIEELPEASRTYKVGTTWIIRGFYSLKADGTSEATFQGIIDNIRDKFRANPSVNSTVLTSDSLQIDANEPRMFGRVLCHYMEGRLVTVEEETY